MSAKEMFEALEYEKFFLEKGIFYIKKASDCPESKVVAFLNEKKNYQVFLKNPKGRFSRFIEPELKEAIDQHMKEVGWALD